MNKQQFDKKASEFKKIFEFPVLFDRYMLLATNQWSIDIVEFDRQLDKRIPEYDADKCTYKGIEEYSVSKVVKEVYGERTNELIREMISLTK